MYMDLMGDDSDDVESEYGFVEVVPQADQEAPEDDVGVEAYEEEVEAAAAEEEAAEDSTGIRRSSGQRSWTRWA